MTQKSSITCLRSSPVFAPKIDQSAVLPFQKFKASALTLKSAENLSIGIMFMLTGWILRCSALVIKKSIQSYLNNPLGFKLSNLEEKISNFKESLDPKTREKLSAEIQTLSQGVTELKNNVDNREQQKNSDANEKEFLKLKSDFLSLKQKAPSNFENSRIQEAEATKIVKISSKELYKIIEENSQMAKTLKAMDKIQAEQNPSWWKSAADVCSGVIFGICSSVAVSLGINSANKQNLPERQNAETQVSIKMEDIEINRNQQAYAQQNKVVDIEINRNQQAYTQQNKVVDIEIVNKNKSAKGVIKINLDRLKNFSKRINSNLPKPVIIENSRTGLEKIKSKSSSSDDTYKNQLPQKKTGVLPKKVVPYIFTTKEGRKKLSSAPPNHIKEFEDMFDYPELQNSEILSDMLTGKTDWE